MEPEPAELNRMEPEMGRTGWTGNRVEPEMGRTALNRETLEPPEPQIAWGWVDFANINYHWSLMSSHHLL